MIRFALSCDRGHDFDAWFASGDAYGDQAKACSVVSRSFPSAICSSA